MSKLQRTAKYWAASARALLLRRTGDFPGRWRLELASIRSIRKLGNELASQTVRTQAGYHMQLQLADWVDQHIYATGNYEPMVGKVISELLSKGDEAWDIGANIGYFTLLMAKQVGVAGRVLALEPSPTTAERLKQNADLNLNLKKRIAVHPFAAAEKSGELEFHMGPEEHSGVASLRSAVGGCAIRVPTRPIDDFLTVEAVSGGKTMVPKLIKVDVEGAEMAVLRGARRLIEEIQPYWVIEVSANFLADMGTSAAELCSRMTDVGYRMFVIDWSGVRPAKKWTNTLPNQFNAVFVPPNRSLPAIGGYAMESEA